MCIETISINQKWMMLNKQLVRHVHFFIVTNQRVVVFCFKPKQYIRIKFASQTKLSLLHYSWIDGRKIFSPFCVIVCAHCCYCHSFDSFSICDLTNHMCDAYYICFMRLIYICTHTHTHIGRFFYLFSPRFVCLYTEKKSHTHATPHYVCTHITNMETHNITLKC